MLNDLAVLDAVGADQPGGAVQTTAAGLSWAIFGTGVDWSRMIERSPAASTAAHIATLLTGGLLSVLGSGGILHEASAP